MLSQTRTQAPLLKPLKKNPPLALYVHLPWCERKCPYCDFNSHPLKAPIPEQDYIDALIDDFDQDVCNWNLEKRTIHSVFFGGGTPSLFQGESIARFMAHIRPSLSPGCEVSLEANPGTLNADKLESYLKSGINRLSMGAQSGNDAHLKALGRIHCAADTKHCMALARKVGFTRINIDLMFGLPQQSKEQAVSDINWALSLAPDHISYYQLTIEPNTIFARYPPVLPSSDELDWMHQELNKRLTKQGFKRYEVSAYAKKDQESHHNLSIWQFCDYLGVGAGAHGKISTGSGIYRYSKLKSPSLYLRSKKRNATQRQLNCNDGILEFLMNALRIKRGFSLETFVQRTGLQIFVLEQVVGLMIEEGHLIRFRQTLRASARGYRLLDQIMLKISAKLPYNSVL